MFATIGRSWRFAKLSFEIAWENKSLMIFPIFSTISAGLVLASFILPLWGFGFVDTWTQQMQSETFNENDPFLWVLLFLFYFCNYFVIVFFNTGLICSAQRILAGEQAGFGYGFKAATARLPQIIAWAFVSACIGVALKMIESSNKKFGELIAAIIGSAWTALTYFVVPAIAAEKVGPVQAFKRSVATLRNAWGVALVGNFSMGWAALIVLWPLYVTAIGIILLSFLVGMPIFVFFCFLIAFPLFMMGASISSAADGIMKAVLYNYAMGTTLPETIDTNDLADAFASKGR